jgi:hypothetical protein
MLDCFSMTCETDPPLGLNTCKGNYFSKKEKTKFLLFFFEVTCVAGYLAQSTAEHTLPAHVDRTEFNTITTISR